MTGFDNQPLNWRERYPSWRVDKLFTVVFFALPTAAGSAVSFLLGGAFLWAIVRFGRRDFAFKMPAPLLICMAIFAGYFGLTAISALLRGLDEAALEQVMKALPFLLVSLVSARLRNGPAPNLTDTVLFGSAIGAALGALAGIIESYVQNTWRVEGGAGNSGIFGVVSLLLAFLALGGFLKENRRHQIAAAFGFACGIFSLYLSGSRALILYVPVLFVIFLLFWVPTRSWGRLGIVTAAAGTLLVAAATLSVFHHQFGSMMKELSSISNGNVGDSSAGKRKILYKAAWDAFVERPLTGYGPQNLMTAVQPFIPSQYVNQVRFSHLHNHLLDYAVGSGLFGVAALLAVFAAPVWASLQTTAEPENRLVRYLLLVAVLVFFLNGLTNITFAHDIVTSLYIYSTAVILCSGRYREKDIVLLSARKNLLIRDTSAAGQN
jgi:O-antigen ligase